MEASQLLAGRRLVLTGAASGMGEGIARLFTNHGARITLLDVDAEKLSKVAKETGQSSRLCDVSDEAQVNDAISAAAAEMGGLDGLLNVAGILVRGMLVNMDYATFQRLVAVNLAGPFLTMRAAMPHLKAAGQASIVNIASLAGERPQPGMAVYSATKAGLIAMSQAVSTEVGPEVRVNAICPGVIETPMISFMHERENSEQVMTEGIAVGRVGTPLDIAQSALFLTSHNSGFVNGASLIVSGGHYR